MLFFIEISKIVCKAKETFSSGFDVIGFCSATMRVFIRIKHVTIKKSCTENDLTTDSELHLQHQTGKIFA